MLENSIFLDKSPLLIEEHKLYEKETLAFAITNSTLR